MNSRIGLSSYGPGALLAVLCLSLPLAGQALTDLLAKWACSEAPNVETELSQILGQFDTPEDLKKAEDALLSRRKDRRPGFHLVPHPALDEPFAGALIIPKHRGPGPLPIAVVDQPRQGPGSPADELALRARYHDFLALGWGVFWPRQRLFHFPGGVRSTKLPGQIAALRLFVPVDPDRIALVAPAWQRELGGRLRPEGYVGDTSPLCGLIRIHTALIHPGRLGHPERWAGRTVVTVHDDDPPTEVRATLNRLRAASARHRLELLIFERPELLDHPWVGAGRAILRDALPRMRRRAAASELDLALGGDSPARFEWVRSANPAAGIVVRARRTPEAVELERAGAEGPVPALDLFLPAGSEKLPVRWNGSRVSVRRDPRPERLLALRHRLQTGRDAACVLRVRP